MVKGFKKDGKFRPTGNRNKSSLSKKDLKKNTRSKVGITQGGKCHCGAKLPNVRNDQTPYQYCSDECKKNDSRKKQSLDSGSYANETGKYQKEVDVLEKLVPNEGDSNFRDVDLFRMASNVYYDINNNGGANIGEQGSTRSKRDYQVLRSLVDTKELDRYMKIHDYEQEHWDDRDRDYSDGDRAFDKLIESGAMDQIMDNVIEKIKSMPDNHLTKAGL